ncbi:MAG: hypothetical protein ABIT20_24600, partial [Gemmatimonadaceae bacterium]
VPLSIVLFRLRRVLRLGYGRDDILAGLRVGFERRREEFLYEFGAEPTTREKLFRVASLTSGAVALVSVATLIATRGTFVAVVAPIAVTSMYIGIFTTAFSRKWRRLRSATQSGWARFWSDGVGEKLTKLAGYRLGRRAIPADRPTELAIAMNAEAMFDALPREQRDALGDVPALLHELEAHARVARARIDELAAGIAEAQHGRGAQRGASTSRQDTLVADLTERRARAEERLSELVTALENVRLDLLRLRTGGGSVEGVTRDIAAARAVGEEADRLLASGREVEDAIRSVGSEAR